MSNNERDWAENREAHTEFERQLQDVQQRQRDDRKHLDELDSATRETQTAILRHVLTELQRIRAELEANTRETRDLRNIYEQGKFGVKVARGMLAIAAALIAAAAWLADQWLKHGGRS